MACRVCDKESDGETCCLLCGIIWKKTGVRVNKQHKEYMRTAKAPVCKKVNCNVLLVNKNSNSQRYCSDECKPKRVYTEKERIRRKEKNKQLREEAKGVDPYEGTINPYFLRRGELSSNSTEFTGLGNCVYD